MNCTLGYSCLKAPMNAATSANLLIIPRGASVRSLISHHELAIIWMRRGSQCSYACSAERYTRFSVESAVGFGNAVRSISTISTWSISLPTYLVCIINVRNDSP